MTKLTNEEIDKWIETDSLCFDSARRGAEFALQRTEDIMLAFVALYPEHRAALVAYAKFADLCSAK